MAIFSCEGVQGASKTTVAVALAIDEMELNPQLKIVSNVHLNVPNYTHFSLEWFLENLISHELEDCVLILDELYQIMDSRSSQTKINKLMTYFFVQTRKRNVDLILCTHHIDHIDKRAQRSIDIRISCRYYKETPCKKCKCLVCKGTGKVNGLPCKSCTTSAVTHQPTGGSGYHKGQVCDRCLGYGETGTSVGIFLDRRTRRRWTQEWHAPKYWKYFDTHERIGIQQKLIDGISTAEVV